MSHLDDDALLDCVVGPRAAAAARTHLERCPQCARRLETLERLVEDARAGGDLVEPPAAAVQRAVELAETWSARPPRRAPSVVEVIAELVQSFGRGLPEPALAGVRGASIAGESFVFEHDGLRVTVELDEAMLVGQLALPPEMEIPLLAWCERDGACLARAPVSEHGVFQMTGELRPPFDVVLDFGARRVRLSLARSSR